MLKPFKIIKIVEEDDGVQGVFFEVSKREIIGSSASELSADLTKTKTRVTNMASYVGVPAGGDIDLYLLNYLKETGWVL